jgi:hypothetical protein
LRGEGRVKFVGLTMEMSESANYSRESRETEKEEEVWRRRRKCGESRETGVEVGGVGWGGV